MVIRWYSYGLQIGYLEMVIHCPLYTVCIMNEWHGGKGSKRRPYDPEVFDREFDRIFKRKKVKAMCEKCGKYIALQDIKTHDCKE